MALTIIRNESYRPSQLEQALHEYCLKNSLDFTIEWLHGQYYLHSDEVQEKPIGIEIDKTLQRHQDFFKKHSVYKELLARAVGLKSDVRLPVLDLTGGLLGDTLLFLSFGLKVTTLERHPMVSLLIESAIQNAQHPLVKNLTFLPSSAQDFLTMNNWGDVIFFDPMFEDANLKAAPKKEMRIFRDRVGKDQDAAEVFQLARAKNPKRLVIKRPKHSQVLAQNPDVVYEGKSTRYDVFFARNVANSDEIR